MGARQKLHGAHLRRHLVEREPERQRSGSVWERLVTVVVVAGSTLATGLTGDYIVLVAHRYLFVGQSLPVDQPMRIAAHRLRERHRPERLDTCTGKVDRKLKRLGTLAISLELGLADFEQLRRDI